MAKPEAHPAEASNTDEILELLTRQFSPEHILPAVSPEEADLILDYFKRVGYKQVCITFEGSVDFGTPTKDGRSTVGSALAVHDRAYELLGRDDAVVGPTFLLGVFKPLGASVWSLSHGAEVGPSVVDEQALKGEN